MHKSMKVICFGEDSEQAVMFRHMCFPGMVGESIDAYNAFLLKDKAGKPVIVKELDHKELKAIYELIKGRQERIDFEQWLQEFSKESEEKRQEDQHAEAISRVR